MKTLAFTTLLISASAFATSQLTAPESAALKFNQWYITQLNADKDPLGKIDSLQPYVTTDTYSAFKSLYAVNNGGKDMPDADPFIKAQDWDKDWDKVTVIRSDYDPVCTNVYVAFGVKKEHVVADCMVEEAGDWKIRSATLIK